MSDRNFDNETSSRRGQEGFRRFSQDDYARNSLSRQSRDDQRFGMDNDEGLYDDDRALFRSGMGGGMASRNWQDEGYERRSERGGQRQLGGGDIERSANRDRGADSQSQQNAGWTQRSTMGQRGYGRDHGFAPNSGMSYGRDRYGMGGSYEGASQHDLADQQGYGRDAYNSGDTDRYAIRSGSLLGRGIQNHEARQDRGMSQDAWRHQFTGRGPKGWQRSDERVHEDVCDALEAHPEIDASEIEVKVEQGEVSLTGSVDSRWAKRLAEDAIEHVRGVKDVHNHLRCQQHVARRDQASRDQGKDYSAKDSMTSTAAASQRDMGNATGAASSTKPSQKTDKLHA